MIASLGHAHFLVGSILNGEYSGEHSGQSNYNTIVQLNADLAALYGSRFVDVRTPLVAGYNPGNTMDVADHTADVPPVSLRRIEAATTLTQSIVTGDTAFTTSGARASAEVLLIDSEYIFVTGVSGNNVTACTRGYGGSTAASHSNAASIVGVDPIHLNDAGYAIVATAFEAAQLSNGW